MYYADQVCERAKMHLRSNAQGDTVLHDVHDDLRYTMVCHILLSDLHILKYGVSVLAVSKGNTVSH